VEGEGVKVAGRIGFFRICLGTGKPAHHVDIVGVAGSIPAAPTIVFPWFAKALSPSSPGGLFAVQIAGPRRVHDERQDTAVTCSAMGRRNPLRRPTSFGQLARISRTATWRQPEPSLRSERWVCGGSRKHRDTAAQRGLDQWGRPLGRAYTLSRSRDGRAADRVSRMARPSGRCRTDPLPHRRLISGPYARATLACGGVPYRHSPCVTKSSGIFSGLHREFDCAAPSCGPGRR
jgi:hypothetical protein